MESNLDTVYPATEYTVTVVRPYTWTDYVESIPAAEKEMLDRVFTFLLTVDRYDSLVADVYVFLPLIVGILVTTRATIKSAGEIQWQNVAGYVAGFLMAVILPFLLFLEISSHGLSRLPSIDTKQEFSSALALLKEKPSLMEHLNAYIELPLEIQSFNANRHYGYAAEMFEAETGYTTELPVAWNEMFSGPPWRSTVKELLEKSRD